MGPNIANIMLPKKQKEGSFKQYELKSLWDAINSFNQIGPETWDFVFMHKFEGN